MKKILQQVHGPALQPAMPVGITVFAAKVSFGIGGCHSKYTCEPAPEHSTRAAKEYGGGDPYDIAGAKSGSKCGGEGTKAAESMGRRISIFSQGQAYASDDPALDESQMECVVEVKTHKENKDGTAP